MLRIKALNDQEVSGNEDDLERVTKEAEVSPKILDMFFHFSCCVCVFFIRDDNCVCGKEALQRDFVDFLTEISWFFPGNSYIF